MKLGEIKIEALKLMYADYLDEITINNLEDLKDDENYGRYLNAMNGSINRCFSRIEENEILPTNRAILDISKGDIVNRRVRFNLNTIVSDFLSVDRIICESPSKYIGDYDFIMETSRDILINIDSVNDTLILVYNPTIQRILNTQDNNEEINIPDKIACLIPYFIKGDLFRDEEPYEANQARSIFETSLNEIKNNRNSRQSRVDLIYEME